MVSGQWRMVIRFPGRSVDFLFHPIRHKYVCFPRAPVVAVTAKYDPFSIGAEHRKGIKGPVVTDFLQACSINVDRVHIEGKPAAVFVVTAKDHPAIR
jgi:hypothetical protein